MELESLDKEAWWGPVNTHGHMLCRAAWDLSAAFAGNNTRSTDRVHFRFSVTLVAGVRACMGRIRLLCLCISRTQVRHVFLLCFPGCEGYRE